MPENTQQFAQNVAQTLIGDEAAHPAQPLIQMQGIRKSYYIGQPNELEILHGIDLTVYPGEFVAIVGESGSGKSTLIKAAMGLLGSSGMVTRGDIWFEGKSLPDVPPKELRRICGEKIGMIFQDCGASLSPTRTIGEQIIESMAAHRKVDVAEAKRAALELFEKLHFQDGERIWDSYPFELSGGMNQRAGIAIAMLMNPAVLLADEPTSALDMAVQRQVVEEMLHIRETFGTAIIIVTHDIGVVSAMADSIVVLSNGRVMEYAAAKDVLENPQNDYTIKLLSAVPRLRREKA